jgi:predicted transcriptional regulator
MAPATETTRPIQKDAMSSTLVSTPAHRAADHLAPKACLDTEVRNVMTPDVVSIPADAPLREVLRTLAENRLGSVLVVDPVSERPLGWVTARRLLSRIAEDETLHARDAITQEPASIQPWATVRQALTALQQPGVSKLLVGRIPGIPPQGILSDVDVIALAADRTATR